MFALVEDYRKIGVSGKAYCQTRGIVPSTLYYWIKKFDESTSVGGFVQIKPRPWVNKTTELIYHNGIRTAISSSELQYSSPYQNVLREVDTGQRGPPYVWLERINIV